MRTNKSTKAMTTKATELQRERNANGTFKSVHGGTKSQPYRVWCAMKERCYNRHNKRYQNYGGKGVKVCDEWLQYPEFLEWYNAHYFEGGTIDRIDGNGDYEPSNCRIVTSYVQNRNYTRNHIITYKGETLCLADMADKYGVKRTTVLFRLKQGMPLDDVFDKTDRRTLRWKK